MTTLQPEVARRSGNPESSSSARGYPQAPHASEASQFGRPASAAEADKSSNVQQVRAITSYDNRQRIRRMSEDLQQQEQHLLTSSSTDNKRLVDDYVVRPQRRSIRATYAANDGTANEKETAIGAENRYDEDGNLEDEPAETPSKSKTSKRNMSWLTAAMLSICLEDPCKCSFSPSAGGSAGGGVGSSYRSAGMGTQLRRHGRGTSAGAYHSPSGLLNCPPSSAVALRSTASVSADAKRKSAPLQSDLRHRGRKRRRGTRYGTSGFIGGVGGVYEQSYFRRPGYYGES